MKILIIEDESRLVYLIQKSLARAGMQSDSFSSISEAEAALKTYCYDALILDLTLPDGRGRDLLTRNRQSGGTIPVLILTAEDAVDSRIDCLNLGADDYVIKPFEMEELIARVRALLRRPGGSLGLTIELGNMAFDTIGRSVTVDGIPVNLGRRELGILEHLMRRAGRMVPKDVLEEKLYSSVDPPGSNPIPVHIHMLRKKLSDLNANIEIHTVRGVGYILNLGT